MRKHVVMGVVVLAAIATGGCVSNGRYMEAVEEVEAAKTELEKARAQKNAFEQQVKSLKELNTKLSADAELMSAELQRVRDTREKERGNVSGQVKDYEQKVKDLTRVNRTLRRENEDYKHRNEVLKSTLARYQKELKERPRSIEPATAPPPPRTTPAPPASPAVAIPPVPAPAPAAGSVNINTASADTLMASLRLTKDVADRVVANRPYRLKGELVAKNVIPKETFDLIRDRITVAQ
ncbi:MAG: helix-hairpin-helix domain-containing protein [Nitrospiraceae bacterium]